MPSTADVKSLPLHRQIMLVGGVLLFVSLFFPWRSNDFISANGWYGIGTAVGVLAVLLLAWEGLRVLGATQQIKLNQDLLAVGLAALIVLFGLIQFVQSLTGGSDYGPGFGAFLNFVFILGLGYAAFLAFQAAGGSAAVTTSGQSAASQPAAESVPPPAAPVPAPPAPPVASEATVAPEAPAAPEATVAPEEPAADDGDNDGRPQAG